MSKEDQRGEPEAGASAAAPPESADESGSPTLTAEGTTEASDAPSDVSRAPGGLELRGATVAPGLALGRVHRKDYDLERTGVTRITRDEVDRELNRFRRALDDSQAQIQDLKARLKGKVPEEDARILDTHSTYLRDSVFIADVENLILGEQMRLDAAIAKVVGDFDRIFRLVQSDTLRQSAVDLRDVGIRVLRNLEQSIESAGPEPEQDDYVLVARELSIVDMFTLANEHVRGIVTEEGALTSHAAVFARSMRIPTITGVEGVLDSVQEGDFVILDATEGLLRVNPEERVREQYELTAQEGASDAAASADRPDWARSAGRTRDGVTIELGASCGNVPELEQAVQLGMEFIGLYRTELLFLLDQAPPTLESLTQHYSTVVAGAQGAPITFRLASLDSGLGLSYLHEKAERNPSLGQVGIRALLAHPHLLRRQIQALLLAARDADVRIALPFVTDCGELRRVKEILFEERVELRKQTGEGELATSLPVGVVVETPAAMLGVRDLALEADFLMLNLDALQQYLLASDREEPAFAQRFQTLHPFVLRALTKAAEVAEGENRPLWIFGAGTRSEENLPLLVGAGLRHFCVPPSDLRAFLARLDEIDTKQASRAVRTAARGACDEETRSLVAGYRHGYPRA